MNFSDHNVIVPDVSFWQDDDNTARKIDFAQMKAAGAVGVILRGGQSTWHDEDFADYRRDAKAAGLPRGYYFFYDSRSEPGRQANLWRAGIGDDLPELGLWSDFEDGYNGPYHGERYWKQFVLAMDAFYPQVRRRGVYTADWWWSRQMVNDPLFWASYPLWVAQYIDDPYYVDLPRPWLSKGCVLWQFTAHGNDTLYGVESANIDLNKFNGTQEQFKIYFGLGEPTNGETEPTMPYMKVTATALNLRSSAGVQTSPDNDLGTFNLLKDDIVEVGEPVYVSGASWRRVLKIWRGGSVLPFVPSPTGQYWAAEAYMVAVSFLPPAEPPSEPEPVYPVSASVTMSDGSVWTGLMVKQ